ncbi:arf-GAP with dual PH domain-containing protein 1-like [Ruditapes philippinarum]|uniref:arf-GAP with dual PH domain-containing protein 1-like n=1 Tax=Ruditapes philippinarum TaxID=129788 RepID=UPI00295B2F45|nr:arf-GAP with dual PH domain-containing protein 1-like [Ruditapes philippinarum]
MSERNRQVLNELLKKPGNSCCADCKCEENVEWASCNLGIFLCQDCAGIHRSLGVDTSRVKSIKLDNWDDDQVMKMSEKGNDVVNKKYEQHLPKYYMRPTRHDVEILRAQFIRAKYERMEFVYPAKQAPYSSNTKEGNLMKKGKHDKKYNPRRFIINSKDNCLQYFNKESPKGPKDTVPLDDINIVFVPEKIGNPNGFQISYMKNGTTRNLFLYCDDSKEAIDWFTAIRCAKLERRRLAFPDRNEDELCKDLTSNFLCEGFLWKKGPRNEPYKKRWFTLDRRKLMYLSDPLSPIPKGEVYIGHKDAGYSVANSTKNKSDILEFVLETTERGFELKAESIEDKEKWIVALTNVITNPPTPQDIKMCSMMNRR